MATLISTAFIVRGSRFDPGEFTALLGVQPTKVWRTGDPIPKTILRHKDDGWLLSSGEQAVDEKSAINLVTQVKHLVDCLQPHTVKLKEMQGRLSLETKLYCVLYLEGDERPTIQFSPDTITWLAEVGAGIDVVTHH